MIVCYLLILSLLINGHGIFMIFRNVISEDCEQWCGMYSIIMLLCFLVVHILLLNVAQSFRNGLYAGYLSVLKILGGGRLDMTQLLPESVVYEPMEKATRYYSI